MFSLLLLAGFVLSFPLETSTATSHQGTGQLTAEGSFVIPELQYIKRDEVDTADKRKEAIENYKHVLEDKEDWRQRYYSEYEKTKPIVAAGDLDEIYRVTGVPKYVGWNTEKNDEYFQGKDKELGDEITKINHDLKILTQ